jgi:hypothetical protein
MKLNLKATKTLIITLGLLAAMIIYRIIIDVSYYWYAPLFVIIIILGLFAIVYYQKTEKPVCKNCNHKMKLETKKLIKQDEEIRYGQFVFIYKYEYEYKCPNCSEVVHINKTVKK